MKFAAGFLLFAGLMSGQADAPFPPRETVIAVLNGKDLTWGELDDYLKSLPPAGRSAALVNRESLVHQYGMMKLLIKAAEDEKLEQKDPYQSMIAGARAQILTQGVIDYRYTQVRVTQEIAQKFYDTHLENYQQVKLRGIYIAFGGEAKGGVKTRTEAEAKTEIDNVRKELMGGADFAELAKKRSEDEKTKALGGDFGVVHKTVAPDDVQKVAFSQKPGEIGQPVRQRSGFYIFRTEAPTVRQFSEVEHEVVAAVTEQQMRGWLDGLNAAVTLKVKDAAFFGSKAAAPPK